MLSPPLAGSPFLLDGEHLSEVRNGPMGAGNFNFHGGVLIISTDRFRLRWEDGCITALETRFNGGQSLTTATPVIPVTWLPNGPGSFALDLEAGQDQHKPFWTHRLDRQPPEFPAHAPALEAESVICEEITNGVRLVYSGLQNDPTASLIQELTIDPENGDLIISQSAHSDLPGLFGIGFSLLNLRPDIDFALPYFSGVSVGGRHTNEIRGWAWPGAWSAGLIIGEIPGGGSFFVFADDPGLNPKYLKLYSSTNAQALGFEACGQSPYGEKRELEVFSWRFNTFEKGWQQPAGRYKDWLAVAYGCKPARERPPSWFADVALFCALPGIDFDVLAEKIDPRHVLIGDYGWSRGFNRNAPFYEPANPDAKAAQIRRLRDMGYHYAVYVAHKLLDLNPTEEVRANEWGNENILQTYGIRTVRDELSGRRAQLNENWIDEDIQLLERVVDTEGPARRGIHPGSDRWIEFYSDLMVRFHERYGMNVFYQDISGSHYGSSGLIDGRSLHEGTVAVEARIREKLPDTAAIGEHWNEVNVAMHMQLASGNYAAWFSDAHYRMLGGERAHPVKAYIFGDYTGLIMYKTPQRNTGNFHLDQNFLEMTGSIPTWRTDARPGTDEAETRLTLLRAQLFIDGFQPYFPDDWETGAVAYMKDDQDRLVKYLREDQSTVCLIFDGDQTGRLYYARVHGEQSFPFSAPCHIDGWLAYDEKGPIGLSPERWYCVFPGKATDSRITLTSIPEGVWIDGVRKSSGYVLVRFEGAGSGPVDYTATVALRDMSTGGSGRINVEAPASVLFVNADAKPLIYETQERFDLSDWELLEVVNGQVTLANIALPSERSWNLDEQRFTGYMIHPPSGGIGAETSLDGFVRVPDDDSVALAFQMGRLGAPGDGVHFVVRINGQEIWREFSPARERKWSPARIPLGEYAGQDILISLAVDCGVSGFSTSNDQSIFADVHFATAGN